MQRIPYEVQSLISASYHINNFSAVVAELVFNSLDANSNSIAIRVNIEEYSIQVIDNGDGINRNDFDLLGKRYSTSKYVNIDGIKCIPTMYGFRGLSLACIIEVSKIFKVISKTKNFEETWMKLFSKGKCKQISKTTSRPSKGTTVEIKGFLYNLNIQRKTSKSGNEIMAIKILLEQLSLIHINVSFSLRDDEKNEIIFQIHRNRDIYSTLKCLWDIRPDELQELQVEKKQYKVKAFISKNSSDFKKYQWIYLNRKIVCKSQIHKYFNKQLIKTLGDQRNKLTKPDLLDVHQISKELVQTFCRSMGMNILTKEFYILHNND